MVKLLQETWKMFIETQGNLTKELQIIDENPSNFKVASSILWFESVDYYSSIGPAFHTVSDGSVVTVSSQF